MGINLLLVDDSSIVRGILRKTIGLTGLPVDAIHEASNGQKALEQLASQPVDLVFLDINMPVMNGLEVMQNIRNTPTLKDIPVVVVSTEGSDERIAQMKELKVLDFLRKPFTPEQIASLIKNILGGKHE